MGWLRNLLPKWGADNSGERVSRSVLRAIQARYDAAVVDKHNERHFAMADGLSAKAANAPGVRERLRNFSRYEVANNCYARGMINTLADVEIGYGAVIHLPRPRGASKRLRDAIKFVESEFENWAIECGLWEKLWTGRIAKAQDGEGCFVFRYNPSLESMVTLDLQPIEADQLSHGSAGDPMDPNFVDGIEVDDFGNPLRYFVLPEHPGDAMSVDQEPIPVPARQFVHWYRVDRPGMLRGLPEIMPALPLFAQLRRVTLAILTAYESAADVAAVIKSNFTPEYDEGDLDAAEAMNLIDMHRGMFMELPDGRDISQVKAEHPTTTYEMFKTEILSEAGRCLQLSRAYALANASGYNYSSVRHDGRGVDRHVEAAHWQCEQQALRKVWRAWWSEASRITGYIDEQAIAAIEGVLPKWLWRQLGHVDRQKEEAGRETALQNNTTTLAEECGREGLHWEDVLEQRAAERARAQELGLVAPPPATGPAEDSDKAADKAGEGEGGDDEVDEDQEDESEIEV